MITLDGRSLTIAQVAAIASAGEPVALAPILAAIRARVRPMVEDREVGPDIEAVETALVGLPEELLV